MESRAELKGAGFGSAGNQVAKTARKRNDDARDYAGETTDTIREYLTAIGQHPLLEKSDEIRLGLAVERRMELKQRRESFSEEYRFQPSTAELAFDIYMALRERLPTLLTFAGILGYEMGRGATVSDALAVAEIRDTLDMPMDAAVKSATALALEVKESEAVAQVAAISRLRWLLPLEVIETLDGAMEGGLSERPDSRCRRLVEDYRKCGQGRGRGPDELQPAAGGEHSAQVPEPGAADAGPGSGKATSD